MPRAAEMLCMSEGASAESSWWVLPFLATPRDLHHTNVAVQGLQAAACSCQIAGLQNVEMLIHSFYIDSLSLPSKKIRGYSSLH